MCEYCGEGHMDGNWEKILIWWKGVNIFNENPNERDLGEIIVRNI